MATRFLLSSSRLDSSRNGVRRMMAKIGLEKACSQIALRSVFCLGECAKQKQKLSDWAVVVGA
jgi:hypothetical protein